MNKPKTQSESWCIKDWLLENEKKTKVWSMWGTRRDSPGEKLFVDFGEWGDNVEKVFSLIKWWKKKVESNWREDYTIRLFLTVIE